MMSFAHEKRLMKRLLKAYSFSEQTRTQTYFVQTDFRFCCGFCSFCHLKTLTLTHRNVFNNIDYIERSENEMTYKECEKHHYSLFSEMRIFVKQLN